MHLREWHAWLDHLTVYGVPWQLLAWLSLQALCGLCVLLVALSADTEQQRRGGKLVPANPTFLM